MRRRLLLPNACHAAAVPPWLLLPRWQHFGPRLRPGGLLPCRQHQQRELCRWLLLHWPHLQVSMSFGLLLSRRQHFGPRLRPGDLLPCWQHGRGGRVQRRLLLRHGSLVCAVPAWRLLPTGQHFCHRVRLGGLLSRWQRDQRQLPYRLLLPQPQRTAGGLQRPGLLLSFWQHFCPRLRAWLLLPQRQRQPAVPEGRQVPLRRRYGQHLVRVGRVSAPGRADRVHGLREAWAHAAARRGRDVHRLRQCPEHGAVGSAVRRQRLDLASRFQRLRVQRLLRRGAAGAVLCARQDTGAPVAVHLCRPGAERPVCGVRLLARRRGLAAEPHLARCPSRSGWRVWQVELCGGFRPGCWHQRVPGPPCGRGHRPRRFLRAGVRQVPQPRAASGSWWRWLGHPVRVWRPAALRPGHCPCAGLCLVLRLGPAGRLLCGVAGAPGHLVLRHERLAAAVSELSPAPSVLAGR